MKIIKSLGDMQAWSRNEREHGKSIGFVPTMGALHEGHLTLVRRAKRENDLAVVSIFVNPLQFGPKEDFKAYPRTLARDLALLKEAKVDVVFIPLAPAMFPEGYSTSISIPSLDGVLEGVSRPGHFKGVLTVVAKLFHLVAPSRAYFGKKDYQQLRLIARMIAELNFPIRLVACSTVREKDGLAMSSRNRYLSKSEREEAVKIYQALYLGQELAAEKVMRRSDQLIKRLSQVLSKIPKSQVDYLAVVDPETLAPMKEIRRPALLVAAVRIGKTRLIDNLLIA